MIKHLILDQIFKYIGDCNKIINGLAPLFTGHDSVLIKFNGRPQAADVLGQGAFEAQSSVAAGNSASDWCFQQDSGILLTLMPTITDGAGRVDGLVTALRDIS